MFQSSWIDRIDILVYWYWLTRCQTNVGMFENAIFTSLKKASLIVNRQSSFSTAEET